MKWLRTNRFKQKKKLIRSSPEEYNDAERHDWTPINYFNQYINEKTIENMVNCTNIKSVVERGKSIQVTSIEMKRFIGCNIFMSSLRYPIMRMFWAKTTRVPLISNTMSRNPFFNIRSFLKVLNDNEITNEEKKDSLWKVRPLLEAVRAGCYRLVRDVHLSIDEQIIPFTGNTKMKQYVRGKPNPTGLKNFILANNYGLVLDFCVYQGKGSSFITESKYPLTVGESAVIHLSKTIPPGTCLYFDRFFTTQKLLDILKTKKILSTGTVMKNNIPKTVNLVSDKILMKKPRGTTIQYVREDKKVCLIKWFDNKPIHLLSTECVKNPIDVCKRWNKIKRVNIDVPQPIIVKQYNENMGGVDLCDRMIAYYRMKYKTNKWTLRTIMHFIDLAVVNSWILYKQDLKRKNTPEKKIPQLLDFRITLAHELINSTQEDDSEDSDDEYVDRHSNSGKHVPLPPVKLEIQVYINKQLLNYL